MRVSLTHRLTYVYDRPVFLDPHVVRLRPREEAAQRLMSWALEVAPGPAGRSEGVDLNGSPFTLLWFDGLHGQLELVMTAEVETLRENPFDYFLSEPGFIALPVEYRAAERAGLEPYLARAEAAPAVDALAREVADAAGPGVVDVIAALAERVSQQVSTVLRRDGEALAAAETLARGAGACRDQAVLFGDACRALGVASRFVSGYALGGQPDAEHQLHAWTEVYLPGAGWRGYDPGLGLAVADRHVGVAAAPEPAGTAPVEGSFRGDAGVRFEYQVTVVAV